MDFLEVLRALHERERDPVRAELERIVQVDPVLRGEGREGQHGADHAHALAVGEGPTHDHARPGLARAGREHLKPDLSVVQQKLHAGRECLEDLRMGHADALRSPRSAVQIEAELGIRGKRHSALRKGAETQLRALQVREDSDGPPDVPLDGPD